MLGWFAGPGLFRPPPSWLCLKATLRQGTAETTQRQDPAAHVPQSLAAVDTHKFNVTLWHSQWCPHGQLPRQSPSFQHLMILPVTSPSTSTWHKPPRCCSEPWEREKLSSVSISAPRWLRGHWAPQMTLDCSQRNQVPSTMVSNVQSRQVASLSSLINTPAFWNYLKSTHFITSMGNTAK